MASQHFDAFKKELSKARVTCCLLVGKMNKKDRDKIIANIKNGKITVVIGTHALIQKDVEFWIEFGCHFGANFEHQGSPRGVSDLVLAWERKEQETALLLE